MQIEMLRLLKTAFFKPQSSMEFLTVSLLAVIIYLLVARKIGGALEIVMTDIPRIVIAALIGIAGTLAVAAAASLYVTPNIASPALRATVTVIAAVLALLAIAVPAVCLIQKGSYFSSLFTIVLSIASALVVVLLVHAGFKAFSSGSGQVGKGVRHKQTLEEAMAQ